MSPRHSKRCGNQARRGKELCRPCESLEAKRQTADRDEATRLGKHCLMCQKPSLKEVRDKCDRKLRTPDKQPHGQGDRLYSVRSVVAGGLPSLGKHSR